MWTDEAKYHVGQRVRKVGGDAEFTGIVTSVFRKLREPYGWRYTVEDDRGLVLIQSDKTLEPA